jgi:hypoxanthine phosphoribosyltransferase
MNDEIESVLITKEELSERITQLGQQIYDDYIDEPIFALCILRGSFMFFADLVRNIGKPVEVAFLHAASYFEGTESSGHVEIDKHMVDVSGKNLIIIEDIIDSGRTLAALIEHFKELNPNSIKVCTLLDKPERRVVPIDVDYVGFEVPDEFVVGYGLDYDQKYRNLPYIGILKREIYS